MGLTEQKIVMDMLAWAGNVSSSVLIIFVNKVLMNRTGYGFKYGEWPQKAYNPMVTAVPQSLGCLALRSPEMSHHRIRHTLPESKSTQHHL